jgi:4-amino-4-deoxy-L-arabinose transferase-like glycosyltransferase
MNAPDAKRTFPGTRASRAALALVALAICLLFAEQYWLQDRCLGIIWVLVDQLSLVAWTVLILLSAMSFGAALLRWLKLRPASDGATALFGVGLGLGTLSILMLVMGTLGYLEKLSWGVALLALLFLGMRDLGVLLRAAIGAVRRTRHASGFRVALWAVLGLFLLLNLTCAFQPPCQYDVLEYHLAAPAAYHDAGRVFFMRDNAYANFPQSAEMLYLLSMNLAGSPERGAILSQLLCAALGFLAAMALRGLLAGVAGRTAGDLAAAIFYTWPAITLYSGSAYVELPLIFYGTLALWGLVWSWRRKLSRPGPRGWVILAGIATGLAMDVKYTAALLFFIPILVWLAGTGFAAGIARKEILRRMGLFAAVSILCFSPWLIRNYADTRDPVYPLLYKAFHSTNWDAQKDARWTQAHSPKDLSPANFVAQAREALFVDSPEGTPVASLMLFLFVPFALMTRRWTRLVALLLAGNLALLYALWFYFTQQNLRFLEVGTPVLAGLSAIGLAALLPHRYAFGLRSAVILLLLIEPSRWVNYISAERSLGSALGIVSTEDYFKTRAPQFYRSFYQPMKAVNDPEIVPPNATVLFLGEAQMFYCRRFYAASTVFDANALEEVVRAARTPEDIRNGLRQRKITHFYVNTSELRRLQTTYRYFYLGQEKLGMLDGFNWDLFARFAKEYLHPIWTYPAEARVASFPWERWPEFLEPSKADHPGNFVAIYELR